MSQWEDKLNNHAVNTTLSSLAERLESDELVSEDTNIIELIDKIIQAKSYASVCLQNLIPALVSQAHLNTVNSQLQNILNELNNFISNGNVAHLNNASNHVEALIPQLHQLPIPRHSASGEHFTESIIQFKSLIEKSFLEIKSVKDDLEQSVSEISEKSLNEHASLKSLEEKILQHSANIEESKTNFSEQLEVFKEQFQQNLNEKISSDKEQLDSVIVTHNEEHQLQLQEQENAGTEIIDSLKSKEKDASDLLQIIGNIGITGNYQKIANQEKESADRWRNIAITLMVGMSLAIAITIFIAASNGFDWKLSLFRIGAALVLAIPATYAAKESSNHRKLENHNRKAELELASLEPFLEKLPNEIKFKIKEGLTEKFFGLNSIVQDNNNDKPVSYSAIFDLLKTAIKK